MDQFVLSQQAGDGIVGDNTRAGLEEDVLVDGMANDLADIGLRESSRLGDLAKRSLAANREGVGNAKAGDGLLTDELVVLNDPIG